MADDWRYSLKLFKERCPGVQWRFESAAEQVWSFYASFLFGNYVRIGQASLDCFVFSKMRPGG